MTSQGNVLVVDDDPGLRDLLSRLLGKKGYQVEKAGTAEEALDVIVKQPIDLILTDLQMPGMGGFGLLDKIRARSKDTPVVMLTAHGSMETVIKAMRRGANDFINKPFKTDELLNIIAREVSRKQESEPVGAAYGVSSQISEAEHNKIDRQLAELRAQTNARCVLLLEGNGYTIEAKGIIEDLNISALSALVAGQEAANSSIASLIGEGEAFRLNYHEGDRYSVYSAQVVTGVFLLIIFGHEAKSGMVLYYTKQVLPELKAILKDIQANTTPATVTTHSDGDYPLDESLMAGLDEQFDELWG